MPTRLDLSSLPEHKRKRIEKDRDRYKNLSEEQLDRRRQKHREWRIRNRDKRRKINNKSYKNGGVKTKQAKKISTSRWRENNRDRCNELARLNQRKLRLKFPEKFQKYLSKRRARIKGASGSFTESQWVARLNYHGGVCYYCGKSGKMTIDHRIPLSRGGSNWPANLVPACKSCNSSKHNKTEFEFLVFKG